MSIHFAELPKSHGTTKEAWTEEAAALRSNPDQWAHFEGRDNIDPKANSALAHQIKTGKLKAFRSGGFEARVVSGQLWARYVGQPA